MEKNLTEIREEIDSIDNELLELFNKRMKLVQRVGEIKHKDKSAIYRPERERDILERLYKLNFEQNGVLSKDGIDDLALVDENLACNFLIEVIKAACSKIKESRNNLISALAPLLSKNK